MTASVHEAGVIISHLSRALLEGTRDLGTVPALVVRIVNDELWKEWADPASGRKYGPFESFERFVVAPAAKGGLGTTVRMLQDLCRQDKTALSAIDREVGHNQGTRSDLGNNVPEVGRPEGNSAAKALRRLHKDRPDLHQRVLNEELSPHAAMIEAGFRSKTITVPTTIPERVAAALRKHMSQEDLAKLVQLLSGDQ